MIGIYTYPIPHRKTQDLAFRLRAKYPEDEFCIISTEYEERKKRFPLIKHRPGNPIPISPKQLADMLDMLYFPVDTDCQFYLIGGAGILDIKDKVIINSHPGYLPNVRGLDALKWAYLEGQPIGVTTHIISDKIDLGTIIDRKIISRGPYEDFYALAMRQYELEIDMLVDTVDTVDGKFVEYLNIDHFDSTYTVRKRMPEEKEFELILKLNKEK